jgi:hypothetical protein
MREELPMDYIDLLKRVAIPLGTIMVLSSALAQEQLTKADLVQLAVTLGVYDNRCEKLAPRLLADVQRMVRMLDKDDVMAAVINEQDKVDRAGEAKWCVAVARANFRKIPKTFFGPRAQGSFGSVSSPSLVCNTLHQPGQQPQTLGAGPSSRKKAVRGGAAARESASQPDRKIS